MTIDFVNLFTITLPSYTKSYTIALEIEWDCKIFFSFFILLCTVSVVY